MITQIAIVFLAYVVAGKLGQSTASIRSGNLGPVWPAYGIALAAILIYGYRVWIGVAAAAFVVALWSPSPAIAAAGQAVGTTLAAVSGAFLLRRLNFQTALARLQDALSLIVVGAFGSALVSASIGTLVLYATQVRAYSGIGRAWLVYWLGDSTGVLLITALILTLPELFKIRSWERRVELAALTLFLLLASVATFSDVLFFRVQVDLLAFAVLPFVMWAAIRFGMCGATVATFLIAYVGTVETALGSGPFARGTPFANAVFLDVFLTVLSVSGMVLAAVIGERERAREEREQLVREQASMDVRLRLATIVESSDDAILGVDLDGTITDWSKGAEVMYGYSADEAIGQSIFLLIPPERGNSCQKIIDEVRKGAVVRHYETLRRKKDGTDVEVSLTGSPVFSGDGRVVALSSIERDIAQRKRQEEVLRNSEERFRLAAHAGKVLAYEWDAASDTIARSQESSRILGIDQSTRVTGKQALAGIHLDDRDEVKAALAALSPENPYLNVSYRTFRPNGTMLWAEVNSIAHFDQNGRPARVVGMLVDITERKQAEAALADARSRLVEAQEKERTRIARELHDDIGQRLALLTIQLDQLQRSTPELNDGFRNRLNELRQQALEIGADIQSLSHELHSARLEYLGIAAAVAGFCRDFAEKQDVEIDCNICDLPNQVERTVSLCLFRVMQEALHNSLKHSGVKHFEVGLWATTGQIHMTITDSGTGFDIEVARKSRGLGLVSMEERVKLLEGEFSVISGANRGTTIHVRVPIASSTHSARIAG